MISHKKVNCMLSLIEKVKDYGIAMFQAGLSTLSKDRRNDTPTKIDSAVEELKCIEKEFEKVIEDAARYRWIKEHVIAVPVDARHNEFFQDLREKYIFDRHLIARSGVGRDISFDDAVDIARGEYQEEE